MASRMMITYFIYISLIACIIYLLYSLIIEDYGYYVISLPSESVITTAKYGMYDEINLPPESEITTDHHGRHICPQHSPILEGSMKMRFSDVPTLKQMTKMFKWLKPGGRHKPEECLSRHKVAVLIPYRNRQEHLNILLYVLHPMLQHQLLDYGIFVIEQSNGTLFNRGLLFNIGYVEALKVDNYSCFVFHDVDLVPENDKILYGCIDSPIHLSAAIDIFNYRLLYDELFGGVSAMLRTHFEAVNGFSNLYPGWGGEDDDIYHRMVRKTLRLKRFPMDISRYTMMKHVRNVANPERFELLKKALIRMDVDGINSSNAYYEKSNFYEMPLYTKIVVDVHQ
ncbi:beta-1,4-galactosyltransferase 1-like isoform X1 [Ostrea edulis]|uniref:beta-1,4-galactosyltransferase 1-like isoform X1 n=2 Tax=Ostrea edulis TaxID=37623 RepID=UPI0024AEBCF5|nr:beta-1,4-galactosyltransferase 1-like isoform X1 [Ostrea edulis]